MPFAVDARGLACPEPVLRAKQAMSDHREISVIVDNAAAVENIRRLAVRNGYGFSVAEKEGAWAIALSRPAGEEPAATDPVAKDGDAVPRAEALFACTLAPDKPAGPLVVVLSDNHLGRGDDVLGDLLIRSFVHTLTQLAPRPEAIICYNGGVKLAANDSPVLDDLRHLAQAGTDIIVCGACVNYFDLENRIAAGRISHMDEIAEIMAGAGRLVRP